MSSTETGEEEQEFEDNKSGKPPEGLEIGVLTKDQLKTGLLRLSDCRTVEEIMFWLQKYTKNPNADIGRLARTIYRATNQSLRQLTEDRLENLLNEWIEDVSSFLQDYDGNIPENRVDGMFGFKVRSNWHTCVVDLLKVITKSLIHRFNQYGKSSIDFRQTAFFLKIANHENGHKKLHRKPSGVISRDILTTEEEIKAADSLLGEMLDILRALKSSRDDQNAFQEIVRSRLIESLTHETSCALRAAAGL